MRSYKLTKRILYKTVPVAVMAAMSATSASAVKFPSKKNRYMNKPLHVCDQGVFYVGGAPKLTTFGAGPTAGPVTQIIIGAMYVQFQIPMKSKSWPLIMVHGSRYTGSCFQGTAGGTEGWADYTVRNGIPTYVVDQSGRARSGFDQSVIHEGESLIVTDPTAAANLIPTLGGSTTTAWTSWFGHIVPAVPAPLGDITIGQMVRQGAPALQSNGQPAPGQDPLCVNPPADPPRPAHCQQLGRIPMEPEAKWVVDQSIASRTGSGAPAGLGTVVPDQGGHVNATYPLNDRYLALDAYKFNVPNTESTLPPSTCPSCMPAGPDNVNSVNTWTPKALAELVEGLGGAVVATHSQSGSIGHHMTRILKEHGKLNMLKGLITIEGSCALDSSGLALDGSDFKNIPYLAFKGDYANTSAVCQATVDAIKAVSGKADYIQLDQPGPWQGSYAGPFGPDYVGPFAGVSHMMMIESNPAPGRRGKAANRQVMDVMLDWTKKNIKNPRTIECDDDDDDHDHGHGHH
jgi:hypothetical protein